MLTLPPSTRVYVATKPADMRRSFDGPLALVRDLLGHEDPAVRPTVRLPQQVGRPSQGELGPFGMTHGRSRATATRVRASVRN